MQNGFAWSGQAPARLSHAEVTRSRIRPVAQSAGSEAGGAGVNLYPSEYAGVRAVAHFVLQRRVKRCQVCCKGGRERAACAYRGDPGVLDKPIGKGKVCLLRGQTLSGIPNVSRRVDHQVENEPAAHETFAALGQVIADDVSSATSSRVKREVVGGAG